MNSYDDILNSMVKKYEELSNVTLNEQSDIMLRLKVLCGELYNSLEALEFVKRQMFVQSASGEYIDKHALSRGIYRKEAKKAKGEVTFSLDFESENDIVIEKGTVVSTAGENAASYVTDTTVTLYAGSRNVTVPVTAVSGGADYNVVANTVVVMVTPCGAVSKVTNQKAIKGGTDRESDDELRERVLYSYRDISNGTNAVYYKRLAQSVNGVYSASVVAGERGAGTLNVYLCGKRNSPINSSIIEQVQALLNENRELNVDIEVLYAKKLSVSYDINLQVKDGYDFDSVKEELYDKISSYIESLGVGKEALLCEIGELIYHTQGVKNYELPPAFSEDIYPDPNEYCYLSELDIRAVS